MNRRQLITAAVPSLTVLLANNRLALARMQELATPEAEANSKPEIVLQDYTHEEGVYLGTLMTWLEMLQDSLDEMYDGIDAVVDDPESNQAQAMLLMPLGVWRFLALDSQKFDGPGEFAQVQEYAVSALTHLGNAAEVISSGVASTSPTAITLGTEHINLASEEIGKLLDELPFQRPRRTDIFS